VISISKPLSWLLSCIQAAKLIPPSCSVQIHRTQPGPKPPQEEGTMVVTPDPAGQHFIPTYKQGAGNVQADPVIKD
jgi:hypothetical protein